MRGCGVRRLRRSKTHEELGGDEGLHGVKCGVAQTSTHAFSLIVCHVEMVIVESHLELIVIGLDLRL